MKKYRMFLFILVSMLAIERISYGKNQAVMENRNDTGVIQTENQLKEEEGFYDKIPMVMVEGKIYYDTGKENSMDDRCGVMDGEITSAVDANQIPAQDNQSNFGLGYGYQYGMDGTIEISIDGKWYIFEENGLICYENTWYNKAELSKKTIQWINWYNGLTKEEQSFINDSPSELLVSDDENAKPSTAGLDLF